MDIQPSYVVSGRSSRLPGDIRKAQNLAANLLDRAIATVDFREGYEDVHRDATVEFAYRCLFTCVGTGNQHHLEALSERLADISPHSAGEILIPLLLRLDNFIKSSPPSLLPVLTLKNFYKAAIPRFMDRMNKDEPNREEIDVIMRPIMLSGDAMLVEEM